MKKINILGSFKKDQNPNFIGAWNIENDVLCKEIIDFFEENIGLQKSGRSALGRDFTIKKSTDIAIYPNSLKDQKYECFNNYIKELYKCYSDYQNQWPFLKEMLKNINIGTFNIQKYLPGGHFSKMHTERASTANVHRIFAWMTYLNNVDDGGTTNFSHYGIKIKPEIGKTLIWPAEWTHAHNGEIVNSGTKYIITGWMNFPYEDYENIKSKIEQ